MDHLGCLFRRPRPYIYIHRETIACFCRRLLCSTDLLISCPKIFRAVLVIVLCLQCYFMCVWVRTEPPYSRWLRSILGGMCTTYQNPITLSVDALRKMFRGKRSPLLRLNMFHNFEIWKNITYKIRLPIIFNHRRVSLNISIISKSGRSIDKREA